MSGIKKNNYVVITDKSMYPDCITFTPDEFIDQARKGIDVNDDLFFYIPDFTEKQYNLLIKAIQDASWFCFSKEEIPYWCNANTIKIFDRPNDVGFSKASPFIKPEDKEIENEKTLSSNLEQDNSDDELDMVSSDIRSLLESDDVEVNNEDKEAIINLYGSSKGGTGKTFTCIISAYRYAKQHPGKKIALLDADITDPQVSITIHQTNPTLFNYWRSWSNGNTSFEFMEICKTQSPKFPANLDFYLAPKDYVINNDKFWLEVLNNLITNYDVLFIDSGIDYINIPLISYCYKIADRIVLVSTTSIKSTSSVLKQINRLKGNIPSLNQDGKSVYQKSDNIGSRLRLAITGCDPADEKQNNIVLEAFQKQIRIGAIFGYLNSKISRAEFLGKWNIFDNNKKFNDHLDRLIDPNK